MDKNEINKICSVLYIAALDSGYEWIQFAITKNYPLAPSTSEWNHRITNNRKTEKRHQDHFAHNL